MKNREELAKLFRTKGFQKGVEVGVFDGHYSETLCQNIPGLTLYCVDPWIPYKGYRDHKFQKSMDSAETLAHERLDRYNCNFVKKFSMDAVKDFEDNTLDFVYIDGNHEYSYVKEDIREWTKKVKKGGIIAGHDYYITKTGNKGVIDAVNEYVKEHGYKLNLTKWDENNPVIDDRQPSWFFER